MGIVNAQIAVYPLTSDGIPSSTDPNLTASNFTNGVGTGNFSFGASGASANNWSVGAIDPTDHFQISLTANTGYTITIQQILFSERRSLTGPHNYAVQWSKSADFSSPITIADVVVPDDDLERSGNISSLNILVLSGETIYIRWSGYNAEGTSGTWRINDNSLSFVGLVEEENTNNINTKILAPTAQIAASSVSSLSTSPAQAFDVFKFKISDLGTSDGQATHMKQISIKNNNPASSADWMQTLAGVKLKMGATEINLTNTIISNSSIDLSFAEGALNITDGANQEITLSVYFKTSNLVDNTKLQFWIDKSNHGFMTYMNGSGIEPVLDNDIVSNVFNVQVTASKISFSDYSPYILKNSNFEVRVSASDFFGNVDIDASNQIQLSKGTGTGTLIIPTPAKNLVNGETSWNDLQYNTDGEFTITATDISSALNPVTTNEIHCQTNEGSIVINEIYADPTPPIDLPEFEFLEIYNRSVNAVNLLNWKLIIGTKTITLPAYELKQNSFVILCSSAALADYNSFGSTLGLLSSTDLTNSGKLLTLENDLGEVIHNVNYNIGWYKDNAKDDGGWSLEMIDPENICSGEFNWKASFDPSGGTPGKNNSVEAVNPDLSAPKLLGGIISGANEIKLYFDERIDSVGAKNLSNFSVDQSIGNPSIISFLSEDPTTLLLAFPSNFTQDHKYILSVNNLSDYCSNAVASAALDVYYHLNQKNDVAITEIMPDPTPKVTLPEYEYIEIFNRTAYPIDLTSWTISVNQTKVDLSPSIINGNDYVILCDNSHSSEFANYGKVIPVNGFPSISDDGCNIILRDSLDTIMSQVNYTQAWFRDANKDDGGWSLEVIDPDNFCSGASNWKESENIAGGTPGIINSVDGINIDNTKPEVAQIFIDSDHSIAIQFSETIDTLISCIKENFSIESLGVPDSIVVLQYDPQTIIQLNYTNPFTSKQTYFLSANSIHDFCGNVLNNYSKSLLYYKANPYDLVINEIMPDPEPAIALPAESYIELFNTSAYPIQLSGWKLFYNTSVKEFPLTEILAGQYIILCDKESETLFQAYGKTIGITSFPDLSNSGAKLTLKSSENEVISYIEYKPDWYQVSAKSDGGWSLEQIDPYNPCGGVTNWRASSDIRGGSPGIINSLNTSNPDSILPKVWHATVLSEQSIRLYFTESLDSSSLVNSVDYLTANLGFPNSVRPVGPDFSSVELSFPSLINKDSVYTLEVQSNLKDCAGNLISFPNSVRFQYPQFPESSDIVVNEILSNPHSDGVDFVELYNKSNKTIDLKNLRLAKRDDDGNLDYVKSIFPNGYLMFSGDFLVLTTDREDILKTYSTPNPQNVLQIDSMPAYSIDSGYVVLADRALNVIDEVKYTEDMHFELIKNQKGVSLERIDYNRSSFDVSNWHSAASTVGFATPAYENSQYSNFSENESKFKIEPEVFSPDNDGYQDIMNIRYNLDESGFTANVFVIDSKGRVIKHLAQNELLEKEGQLSWDGINDEKQVAKMGIYLIYMEIFNLQGKVEKLKKVAVLAGKFN